MKCADCEKDGHQVTLVPDKKFGGDVCPRCERVLVPGMPSNNLHFTSEAAAMRRMKKDQQERILSVSTLAFTQAILGVPRFKK